MWFLRLTFYMVLLGLGAFVGLMVVLKLGSGTSAITVPPVAGLTEEQARFQAERLGLLFEVGSERYDMRISAGRVVNQVPSAGMEARRGQTMRVIVSKGVDTVIVPDWRNLGATQAQIGAKQAGLRIASLAYLRCELPSQAVVAQTPVAGTVVPRESEGALLLSAGSPGFSFVMPDLTGMDGERARWGLQQYGIQTAPSRTVAGQGEPGKVVEQSPLPGYPVERSRIVQLTVGAS